jgi:hypothetical protein
MEKELQAFKNLEEERIYNQIGHFLELCKKRRGEEVAYSQVTASIISGIIFFTLTVSLL